MAGQIVVSSIKTDSDNSISFLANTGATIFSANLASGLSASSFGNNTITSDKIVSVANTKISGNIVSSQITSVANTQLTGTVTNAQVGASVYEGMMFRNRIINGDMRIDQRNAGASVTVNAGAVGVFPVDRFASTNNSSTAAYDLQRVTDAPAGFVNSVKMTVTATDNLSSATQYCRIREGVEANYVDDLGWGGANAKAITVSFWVKSSVTGTFSMSILNSAYNYSYPVSYTISAADTWEYKTINIPGPTAGTWQTGTNAGFYIEWTWGANSNILGPSGSWSANRYEGVTGQVNLMATNGATWFLTGVQVEVGSVATPFERRPFGTELALCQRYYYTHAPKGASNIHTNVFYFNNTEIDGALQFPVAMRTAPSLVTASGTNYYVCERNNGSDFFDAWNSIAYTSTTACGLSCSTNISGTAGQAGWARNSDSTNAFLAFNAEL